MLFVLKLGVRSHNSSEVVVVNRLLVNHHELPPPVLAALALHLALVDRRGWVEVGEVPLQVLVDLVIVLGQTQQGALDLL